MTQLHPHHAVTTGPEPAAALLARGQDAAGRAEFDTALGLLHQAEAQGRAEGSPALQAQACIAQGKIYRDLGEPQRALDRLGQALTLALSCEDEALQGDALNQRAGVYHLGGEYARALKDTAEALHFARRLGDGQRAVHCLINIGILATKLGDFPRALNALSEAYSQACEPLDNPAAQAQCLINLGLLYENMGDDQRALSTCEQALAVLGSMNNRPLEAICTVNLGYAHKRLGQLQEASCHFERALDMALDTGQVKVEIAALDGLGQVRADLGDCAAALALHRVVIRRAQETGDAESEMDALLNLGRAYRRMDDREQAMDALLKGLELARRTGRMKTEAEAHELLAETISALGDAALALKHYREFHRVEKLLFNEEGERRTRQLSIQFDLERAQHETEVYRLRTEVEREAREQAEATVVQRTVELERGRDIIEQQRAELQDKVLCLHGLLDQNEVLRRRLVRAATRSATLNERFLRRLSAELHDGPAQELGFALMKLDSLELEAGAEVSPARREEVNTELEVIHGAVQHALLEMRAISGGMCLPELHHLSLTETLQRVILAHRRRTGSEVELVAAEDGTDIPLPLKITVYRLAQESLTNAFKHAGALGQRVELVSQSCQIRLEISDQGPGFQAHGTLERGEHLGLLGMRERAESLGGDFQVISVPGQGTRVQVLLPVPEFPTRGEEARA